MHNPFRTLLIAAACAATAACGMSGRNDSAGPDSSRTIAVGNFSSIAVAGPYDVQIRTRGKPGVSMKGPQNILARMVVEVDGDTLHVHPQKGRLGKQTWGPHSPVTIVISAAMIDNLAVAGSGDVTVDRIEGPEFKGALAGSGALSIGALAVDKLKLAIGGSGDIAAAGTAAEADYAIAGSGDIQTGKVESRSVEVAIVGSGNVAARATGSAKISIMGSGDATVTGGAKCETSKMGSGSANCS